MSKLKVLIQFPTRERPEKFLKMLQKYQDLIQDHKNTSFHIICDIDDKTMNNSDIINKIRYISEFGSYCDIQFYNNTCKINAMNAGVFYKDFDIVLLASDDMTPVYIGYDEQIRSDMQHFYPDTDGVLWYFDGFRTDLNTLPIIGRKYFDRFGYIYYPEYKGFWCDNEFMEVANKLKKQTFFGTCLIRHDFHAHLGVPGDDLHQKNMRFFDKDGELFKQRKAINFGLPL
jgi:hypothetical protein